MFSLESIVTDELVQGNRAKTWPAPPRICLLDIWLWPSRSARDVWLLGPGQIS